MFKIENYLTLSIIIYLVLISIVIYNKPSLIFDNNGNIKKFGLGKKKTIYPLWLVVIVLSVLSFYMINIIKLINLYY